jgi:hypothetical protein
MPMFHVTNVAPNGECIALGVRLLGWECVKFAKSASLLLKAEITPISFLAFVGFNNN